MVNCKLMCETMSDISIHMCGMLACHKKIGRFKIKPPCFYKSILVLLFYLNFLICHKSVSTFSLTSVVD